MKKTLSVILTLCMILGLCSFSAFAAEATVGSVAAGYTPEGTPITSAAEFAAMTADGKYYHANDITVDATWNKTSDTYKENTPFTGVLDGNGHIDRIVRLDGAAVDELVAVSHTYAEAGEVVFAVGVHGGHFSGLAAEQGAAGLAAAFAHAGDHIGGLGHVELAAGEIIEEEEGLGAEHEAVVHAHGHEVDAHGVVLIELEGELELGAHAVGAGDEHRRLHSRDVGTEEAAEAADVGNDAMRVRAGDHGFDALDQLIAGIDIDTGRGVGVGTGRTHGLSPD